MVRSRMSRPIAVFAAAILYVPAFAAAMFAVPAGASAQGVDPAAYAGLRWRNIGPHRGGRTKAAAGIPDQPNVFYIGVVNGGVWKTTDYGRTWSPIFDDQPTGSIGAIAVAPSNPQIVYVGSGEGLQRPDLSTGDGIYKSTDAGATWTHLGLRDGQQIPQIIVDPVNPDRLFVAVLGHPYGPNEERGIFRSLDGGRTFQKVLYKDADSGAADVIFDPVDSNTLYAVLWQARQGPWENGAFTGPNSGIYKSVDGGNTWRQLTRGLPTFAEGLGRIGITVAPSEPRRLYATVEVNGQGLVYRSDDAGETWRQISDDTRAVSRPSDFAEIKVHPTNPDIVFTGSVVSWKSTDGGRTWKAFRGAPGGDDYQRLWINPKNPDIILIASDQGAIVTVNGGESFSSWYNQPTAQMYHVMTDNAFPYRVCSGQQESGSACIASRGDDGQITFREWHPVGVEEYGYVAPDPLDPDIVYGGKVTRYDRRTGQVQNVGPRPQRGGGPGDYRTVRTAPVVFSIVDPHILYFGSNTVWRTTNGGQAWDQISPDLTRTDSILPPNVGIYANTPAARGRHPGVVYTIAPSYVTTGVIWAGTDDGLIQVTMDGGRTWRDVTPPELRSKPWSKISIMDAGRFDSLTAYAAVNTIRLDDLSPHIYRTHDGGRTWQPITRGLPEGGVVNVVREDPVRRGLLFAGTEQAVYVSFDDGDNWQSLRQNMPATSIRDLVIKDNDVVAGTHGRAFWILDDVSPLRQLTAATTTAAAYLYRPGDAWRVRWNQNTDTPLPPDEPHGENPPDGATIYYSLRSRPAASVTLEILDSQGQTVRRYSSDEVAPPIQDVGNVPAWWIRPTAILSAQPGMHRFVWNLHWSDLPGTNGGYPIAAIYRNTAPSPTGPWVAPGTYTVRLTVDGQRSEQPIVVKMDPRVKTAESVWRRQYDLSMRMYRAAVDAGAASTEVRGLRRQIGDVRARARGTLADRLTGLDRDLATLDGPAGGGRGGRGGRGGAATNSIGASAAALGGLIDALQDADVEPTSQLVEAINRSTGDVERLLARWKELRSAGLASVNEQLRAAGLPVLDPARR
jgi:photosystem II stability/assembly factor-like uncharacterized protein